LSTDLPLRQSYAGNPCRYVGSEVIARCRMVEPSIKN
jgi:hypothetical protein